MSVGLRGIGVPGTMHLFTTINGGAPQAARQAAGFLIHVEGVARAGRVQEI